MLNDSQIERSSNTRLLAPLSLDLLRNSPGMDRASDASGAIAIHLRADRTLDPATANVLASLVKKVGTWVRPDQYPSMGRFPAEQTSIVFNEVEMEVVGIMRSLSSTGQIMSRRSPDGSGAEGRRRAASGSQRPRRMLLAVDINFWS